ncbi:alpha/beta hydrolase [Peribacillus frigoritolerans]|jgi:pimeloyl-ACP methyl ester carboxylesterase|uniref:alpha/beta fold hydrolase n=1 Tax=Peribacillus frigoritolerans TaxID=450367 RepID=UPI002E1FF91A|nr:alpha/beta hydrolase [Peribacillus frigoritolerans]MED3849026.1 alpha/beta hydrolase [Peribacillus frigoritolerans]
MPFVKVEDLSIHYEIEGNGEPLVLLHGMSNNSQSWKEQIQELKEHYTVIAWDAPGYGKSSDPAEEYRHFKEFARILNGMLDQLKLEKIHLLGHSMGAAIAIEYCSLYPNKVNKLILADSTRGAAALSPEENETKLKNRLFSIENLSTKEIAEKRIQALLSPHASENVHARVKEIMTQIRPAGYRSVAYSLYHLNQMSMLSHIAVPVLVICGELDTVTPIKESEAIHEKLINSRLVIIPEGGHLCYQENPRKFNSSILEFLKGIE